VYKLFQRILAAHNNVCSLSPTEAKLSYIKAWQALPHHGITYFIVRFKGLKKEVGIWHSALSNLIKPPPHEGGFKWWRRLFVCLSVQFFVCRQSSQSRTCIGNYRTSQKRVMWFRLYFHRRQMFFLLQSMKFFFENCYLQFRENAVLKIVFFCEYMQIKNGVLLLFLLVLGIPLLIVLAVILLHDGNKIEGCCWKFSTRGRLRFW